MSKFVSSKCNRIVTCENAGRKWKQAKSSFLLEERKSALVMVNTISANADGVPRKRGEDAASLSGAPKLDSEGGRTGGKKMKVIADRMLERMGALGMTQRQLAERVGCHVGSISLYVNDKVDPSAPMVVGLATALGVTSDWLLGLDDAPCR